MVCKIMVEYLDDTSEHGGWFEGGRRSVYKERLFGVGWFPFLLSLLILLYSKASTTLTQPWFLPCLHSLDTNFEASSPDHDITLLLRISPTPDPACYNHCTQSNAFNLKMGLNCKILLIEIGIGSGKDTTEHTTKLIKIITRRLGNAEYNELQTSRNTHWKILRAIWECRRKMVVRRIVVVLIYILTDRKKLIIFHLDWVVAMDGCEILNITIYFWSIEVWAHLYNWSWYYWKISLTTNSWQREVQRGLNSNSIIWRSSM